MRYVTFSFDDGFLASTIKTARIFESFGLRAEFNMTAAFAAFGASAAIDHDDLGVDYADFMLLNQLQERGQVIQPMDTTIPIRAKSASQRRRTLWLDVSTFFATV